MVGDVASEVRLNVLLLLRIGLRCTTRSSSSRFELAACCSILCRYRRFLAGCKTKQGTGGEGTSNLSYHRAVGCLHWGHLTVLVVFRTRTQVRRMIFTRALVFAVTHLIKTLVKPKAAPGDTLKLCANGHLFILFSGVWYFSR